MPRIRSVGLILLVAASAAFHSGCGQEPVSVSGSISLDGQPVDNGMIVFYAADGTKGRNGSATIKDGTYQTLPEDAPGAGTYRVEVRWLKKTGRKLPTADPGIMLDETREGMPAAFNRESTLRVEISPGANTHDFALTTKP